LRESRRQRAEALRFSMNKSRQDDGSQDNEFTAAKHTRVERNGRNRGDVRLDDLGILRSRSFLHHHAPTFTLPSRSSSDIPSPFSARAS